MRKVIKIGRCLACANARESCEDSTQCCNGLACQIKIKNKGDEFIKIGRCGDVPMIEKVVRTAPNVAMAWTPKPKPILREMMS